MLVVTFDPFSDPGKVQVQTDKERDVNDKVSYGQVEKHGSRSGPDVFVSYVGEDNKRTSKNGDDRHSCGKGFCRLHFSWNWYRILYVVFVGRPS